MVQSDHSPCGCVNFLEAVHNTSQRKIKGQKGKAIDEIDNGVVMARAAICGGFGSKNSFCKR